MQHLLSGASEKQSAAVSCPALDLDEGSDQGAEVPAVALDKTTPAREEEPILPPLLAPSSSSLDEEVARPSTTVPQDDFRAHQELLKWVASNLGLEVEELKEPTDALFDILVAVAPSEVALPVHEGVVKFVKALWQTSSSLPPTYI